MFSKNDTFELQLLFMKLDFLLILCNYCLSIFYAEMDRERMHLSWTDKRYMHGVSQFITDAKPMLGVGTLSSAYAKIARIKGTFIKLSLYDRTWLPGGSC